MNNFRTLLFLDRFHGVFEKLDIDYPVMRKILQVKLTMDQRRKPTIFNQANKKKKAAEENQFNKSLLMYGLLGLFMIPLVIFGENYIFQMSILFGIIMFLVMTSMVSDFSAVLLDIRDKTILNSKPVDGKTVSMAKTLHVCIYLFFLTGSLAIGPLVAGLVKHGLIFFTIFLAETILLGFFIVAVTAFIYFFILRFFDGEKLKDIINYVQIGLSVAIVVGFQFVGRSFEIVDIKVVFDPAWWHFILPPLWFAAPFEVLLHRNTDACIITMATLVILAPFSFFAAYIKMMPAFERNLLKLAEQGGERRRANRTLSKMFTEVVCTSKEERAFYRFAGNMMRTEREFRLKVYPSLGFSLFFPFLYIFNSLSTGSFAEISTGKGYLNVYFCLIMIPSAVMMLKYSGRYKGAWVFKTVPLENLAPLFSGTLKAFIVKLFLPVYVVVSIIFFFIYGLRILPDLILVFLIAIFFTLISTLLIKRTVPFSESFEAIQQSDGWMMLPYIVLIGIFAGVHYLVTLLDFGVYIYLAVMLAVVVISWKLALRCVFVH
ncbi:hypothetical protein [Bacillus sp. T33-2]|uniref:hypothetical protein n=1 Tax=Bacillus sp. T33-2 TaxID=2054168 RepID=UPI000C75EE6B|nr:hypothetical protein [Bacillus sp. T33-2]PLR92834.1 hypothetical protein CVD19_19760 [Bacillus sp. T33-2]